VVCVIDSDYNLAYCFEGESSPRASKRPAYVSAYCISSLRAPQLLYNAYKFRRTFCVASDDGGVENITCNDLDTILIPKGWLAHARKLVGPGDGYLGKGMTKWAFQVRTWIANFFGPGLYYLWIGLYWRY
jgi:hypothetical protein